MPRAYFKPTSPEEKIELDFDGVDVVAPSWLDEVLIGFKDLYGKARIVCLPSSNPTAEEALKAIGWQ